MKYKEGRIHTTNQPILLLNTINFRNFVLSRVFNLQSNKLNCNYSIAKRIMPSIDKSNDGI